MWPFKTDVRIALKKELQEYSEAAELNILKQQVARNRAQTLPPGINPVQPVQESVLNLLNNGLGLMPLSALLDPYRELLAIPGMIRERMVYKSAVVRTIQQQDFIRFVSKTLYNECTHFRTAVRVIQSMIFGRDGLNIKVVAKKNKNVSETTLEKLNDVINAFIKTNKLPAMTREAHRRYQICGEVFIWIIDDRRDIPGTLRKPTRVVFMEPDFVRPSEKHAANFEDPAVGGGVSPANTDWSFGIKNKSLDYTTPEAYQIVWPNQTEEVISADRMIHYKDVEFGNIKRGVSSAFAVSDELIGATVLRAALREGAKVRAAIAGVVEHSQASDEDLSAMIDTLGSTQGTTTSQQVDSNGNAYNLTAVNTQIGGILHIGKTSKFIEGPTLLDGSAAKMIYDMTINTLSAHWQIPSNALSGESGEAAYASALVEENQYTRAREEDQGLHCQLWSDVLDIVMPIELTRLNIDPAILNEVEVQVSGPSLVVRNRKEEAEKDSILLQNKIESRETVQIEQGLDPSAEDEKIDSDPMHPDKEEEGADKDTPETTGGQRQRDEK